MSESELSGEALVSAGNVAQYLSFLSRNECFALPIDQVREIIEFEGVTPVPMMPAFVRGVINLRGNVVPVIDLASRFGRQRSEAGRRTCIIILELDGDMGLYRLGLVVDGVDAVLDIAADIIEVAPDFGAGIRTDFIAGMARHRTGFIIILNVGKVLSLEDMQVLVEAAQDGADALSVDTGAVMRA